MLIFYALLLVAGLVAGSFLGMLTFRLPRGIGLSGRSFCDHCKKRILWYHNIPLASFLALRGRCAYCKHKISLRYPLVEFTTSASFLFLGSVVLLANMDLGLGTPQSLVFLLFLAFVSLALVFVDLEFKVLPDFLLLVLAIAIFLVLLTLPSPFLFINLFWGFLAFLFFLVIYLATRGRGMGFGDVKLSFILGSFLGYPSFLVWIFLSFLTGAAGGLIMMIAGRAKRNSQIAFGPYLILSFWVALFWGKTIYDWYLNR